MYISIWMCISKSFKLVQERGILRSTYECVSPTSVGAGHPLPSRNNTSWPPWWISCPLSHIDDSDVMDASLFSQDPAEYSYPVSSVLPFGIMKTSNILLCTMDHKWLWTMHNGAPGRSPTLLTLMQRGVPVSCQISQWYPSQQVSVMSCILHRPACCRNATQDVGQMHRTVEDNYSKGQSHEGVK